MKTNIITLLAVLFSAGILITACEQNELAEVQQTPTQQVEKGAVNLELDIELCYDPEQVEPYAVCPHVIDPVCACNMVTYQNGCLARAAGWTEIKPGPCPIREACRSDLLASALRNVDYNCLAVYQPVCGCDGRTYGNACVAVGNGVLVFAPGECPNVGDIIDDIEPRTPIDIELCYDPKQVEPYAICPDVIDPVCACNMVTYQNECQARAAGWTQVTDGPCPIKEACRSDLLASALQNIDYQCAAVYQPVCGCDGKTYSNSCVAVGNGVLAFVPGECGNPGGGVVRDIIGDIAIRRP